MRNVMKCVFFFLLLTLFASSLHAETIVSREDTDYIFSLNRAGWEAYAVRMKHPEGWEVQLSPQDTGTGVMAFDTRTGLGLSVQPLYDGNSGPPTILVVGSYYPLNSLPPFTDDFKRSLERDAAKDLGPGYSVSASYARLRDAPFEGIKLMITKKRAGN
jgi:hypothetical protein